MSTFLQRGAGVEASLREVSPRKVIRSSTAVISILLLGVFAVYYLFVRFDSFSFWYAMKPGVLVTMAEETGRLPIDPYGSPDYWYKEGINFHSHRWASTLVFLAVRYATGLDIMRLSSNAVGILIYLVALLYAYASVEGGLGSTNYLGLILAGLLTISGHYILSWVYHSGGWPGASLGLLTVGLLFSFARRSHSDTRILGNLVFLIAFTYWVYHSVAATLLVFLWVLSVYSFVRRAVAKRDRPSPSVVNVFFSLAAISLIVSFVDPLFSSIVRSGLFRPLLTLELFLKSLLSRGDVAPYQVGYSLLGRVMLLLPTLTLMMVAIWLFVWFILHPVPNSNEPETGRNEALLLGALVVTALVLPLASVLAFGGVSWVQSSYLLLVGVPAMLVRYAKWGGRARQSVATGVAVFLLIVTGFSTVVLFRDPVAHYGDIQPSDFAVVKWSARRITRRFLADAFYTGLILMENHDAPITAAQGDLKLLGQAIYSGPVGFAGLLTAGGAEIALLGDRNLRKLHPAGIRHSFTTPDFLLEPLPDYDFSAATFQVLYNNGSVRILLLDNGQLSAKR